MHKILTTVSALLMACAVADPAGAIPPRKGHQATEATPPKTAAAQTTATQATASQAASSLAEYKPPSCNPKSALGVSREIEIDTSTGLVYGEQYRTSPVLLEDKEVVLTFDDGPIGKGTRDILDALDRHCTKATFFMVGRMAVVYPDTVKDAERRGHTIGTHTWSHANLGAKSLEGGAAEVEKGFSAVAAALGKPIAPFFRFPYLSDPDRMIEYLKKRNVAIWGIDVDSYDTRGFSATRIAKWTLDNVKREGRGVILFHDIKGTTQKAVPEVLDELHAAGFKVVHLKPKAMLATETRHDEAVAAIFDSATGKRITSKERKGKKPTLASTDDDTEAAAPAKPKRSKAKRGSSKRKKRSTEAEAPAAPTIGVGRGA